MGSREAATEQKPGDLEEGGEEGEVRRPRASQLLYNALKGEEMEGEKEEEEKAFDRREPQDKKRERKEKV